jgi:hypothetical protein
MAIITSKYYRTSSFTTNTSDSTIKIGDDYLDFSGYETVSTMRFYTDGGLTTATDADPGDDFSCGVQLKINGTWTANISTTWLYIPPWGDDVLVEGYFDVSSKSADIIRYGIDGIRLKFGTYAEVKAWKKYDYICEFTATKPVSLDKPTNVSATQNNTTLTVNWGHAYYSGSGTRTYAVIASNYDLWGGYNTLGTGYTGTQASFTIQDSWRGYPINIWVIAYATDYGGDGNWSDTYATITPQILGVIRYCDNGTWKECIPYYVVNGQWKECIPYYVVNGQWKELI